jgi:hypothetical protein
MLNSQKKWRRISPVRDRCWFDAVVWIQMAAIGPLNCLKGLLQ